jgi:hypothetical protein
MKKVKEEGHYTIKRVKVLPKMGNANFLYAITSNRIESFYRWTPIGKYEIISIGAASVEKTSDLTNDGADGINPFITASDVVHPSNTSEFSNDGADGVNPFITALDVTSSLYLGVYATLGALQIAHPTALPGNYANVDAGIGFDVERYLWDDNDNSWVLGEGTHIANTSELINDGENGVDVFITAGDVILPASELLDVSATYTGLLGFDVTADKFPINNLWYSSTPNSIVLTAADGSLDRIDLIVANVNGTVGFITGIAAATPSQPDYDPSIYFPIKFVLVPATATALVQYTDTLVFDEGTNGPTEWDYSIPNSGSTISTNDFFSGTNSWEHASVGNNLGYMSLTSATTFQGDEINTLTFRLKLKEQLNANISVELKSSGSLVQSYSIASGQFGFSKSNLAWQQITIPVGNSNLGPIAIDEITFQLGRNNFDGFFLDFVVVQSSNAVIQPPVVVTHPTHTSSFINNGANGIDPYITAQDTTSATGLELLTEGGNNWRFIGRNPDNYGNGGSQAVDFSLSDLASGTLGATGAYASAFGYRVTASGSYSHVRGNGGSAIGNYSTSIGLNNSVSGDQSFGNGEGNIISGWLQYAHGYFNNVSGFGLGFALGESNTVTSYATMAFGYHNEETAGAGYNFIGGQNGKLFGDACFMYGAALEQAAGGQVTGMTVLGMGNTELPIGGTRHEATNPLLIIGNGTINTPAAPWTPIVKSNAVELLRNGVFRLPSTTIAIIDAAHTATGKQVPTTEWVVAQIDALDTPITRGFSVSDEVSDLEVGLQALTYIMPDSMTLTNVIATVNEAPEGSTLIFDVNQNGTSILSTLVSIDAEAAATGTVTLDTGASGTVDSITVDSIEVMSGAVAFITDLPATATAVAANITANTSVPDYTAIAVGAVITITSVTKGDSVNGFVVLSTATTITSSDTNMAAGETEKTSNTASVQPVISNANLTVNSEITIDIDQIGSAIAGTGLKIWFIGTKV